MTSMIMGISAAVAFYSFMAIFSFKHYLRNKGYGRWIKIGFILSFVFASIGVIGSILTPILLINFAKNEIEMSIISISIKFLIYAAAFCLIWWLLMKIAGILGEVKKEHIESNSKKTKCMYCSENVIPIRNTTNYCLHSILTAITASTWLIVWFFGAVKNTMSWKCPSCGEINSNLEKRDENNTENNDNSKVEESVESIKTGLSFFKEGDFDAAYNILKDFTEIREPEVCYTLSHLYFMDDREWKDEGKAVKYLRYSAERGHNEAMYELGRLYMSGSYVNQHDRIGWRWLSRAAIQGHTDSQLWVADTYALGLFMPPKEQSYYMAYVLTSIYLKKRPDDQEALQLLKKSESNMSVEEIEKAKAKAIEWQPKASQDYREREAQYSNR